MVDLEVSDDLQSGWLPRSLVGARELSRCNVRTLSCRNENSTTKNKCMARINVCRSNDCIPRN